MKYADQFYLIISIIFDHQCKRKEAPGHLIKVWQKKKKNVGG